MSLASTFIFFSSLMFMYIYLLSFNKLGIWSVTNILENNYYYYVNSIVKFIILNIYIIHPLSQSMLTCHYSWSVISVFSQIHCLKTPCTHCDMLLELYSENRAWVHEIDIERSFKCLQEKVYTSHIGECET